MDMHTNTHTNTSSVLQFRRHKDSAINKLRAYLFKTLRSFKYPAATPEQASVMVLDHQSGGKIQEETMETQSSSSLVMESIQDAAAGTEHVVLERSVADEDESAAVSSSSETLEELVDQMEIEISDHEGEAEPEKAASGGSDEVEKREVVAGKGADVGKSEDFGGEKVEISTNLSLESADRGSAVGDGRSEGDMAFGRRRRISSTHDRIDFPAISTDRQLSNDEIIELMNILQVGKVWPS